MDFHSKFRKSEVVVHYFLRASTDFNSPLKIDILHSGYIIAAFGKL